MNNSSRAEHQKKILEIRKNLLPKRFLRRRRPQHD